MSDYGLDIGLLAAGVPFTGANYYTHALGGSESSAILLAEELAARGNNVKVFSYGDEETYGDKYSVIHNGVQYLRLPDMWETNALYDYDVF